MSGRSELPEQTFLFADLAGFTAMTEAHGDVAAADAVASFFGIVTRLLAEHEAEQVKTIGDAVMARVPDAAQAVRLGVQIVRDVSERHGALGVRVGLNTGAAIEREHDWYGATVNLASRVTGAAQPGEVLMTDATLAAAGEGIADYSVEDRGAVMLKNVAEPVAVHSLRLSDQRGAVGLPVDPVCRMAVDPARSPETRAYRGVLYHFCSAECVRVFDSHPDRYHHFEGQ